MAAQILVDEKIFSIEPDARKLKDSTEYLRIREEVDKKFNPLAGLTDWDKVADLCESVAVNQGIDLPLAIYYTVAVSKKKGLSGLCDGLELIKTLIASQDTRHVTAERRAELLNWMLSRVVSNVRNFTPGTQQLRLLYRCEELNQAIYDWFTATQPEYVPNLDTLGFILFEHINEIECQQFTSKPLLRRKQRSLKSWQVTMIGVFAFLTGLSVLPLKDTFIKSELTAIERLQIQPRVLTSNELYQLKESPDFFIGERQQIELISSYLDAPKQAIAGTVLSQIEYAEGLLTSIALLFPNHSDIKQVNSSWLAKDKEMDGLAEIQLRRFRAARTRLANLARTLESSADKQLILLSKDIENFAISLTPVLGRIDYIQQLTEQGQLGEARRQINELEAISEALVYKTMHLNRDLKKHSTQAEL